MGLHESSLNAFIRLTGEIVSLIIFLIIFVFVLLYLLRRFIFINRRDPPQTTNVPENRGLDPSVINAMPTYSYNENIVGEPAGECSVCLGPISEKDMVKVLPNCKHMFDVECIDKWFVAHSTCPICRAAADPKAKLDGKDKKVLDSMV